MKPAFLAILLVIGLCFGCADVDLHEHEKIAITFNQLPEPVQQQLLLAKSPNAVHGIRVMGGSQSHIINLDSTSVDFIDKSQASSNGAVFGARLFEINGRQFNMAWHNNREHPPFILFEEKLYYSLTPLTYTTTDIQNGAYEYIDLKSYL